jgi:putative glycoside hydrolase with GxGYxYP motif/GxGYxY motif-containing protein
MSQAAFFWLFLAASNPGTISSEEPISVYDLRWTLDLDRKDPAALRKIWDVTHLAAALQGLANRSGPRLYFRYLDVDDFWLKLLREEGAWLAGRKVMELKSLDDLLSTFRADYHGAVVWDESAPATSNVASTVAGAEDLLPLRYDPGGLFGELVERRRALPVKVWLVRPDGASLFTGRGTIPGTDRPSTGSRKADAYAWANLKYLKTGKSSPEKFAYYLDGYWLRAPFACATDQHTLANHDYFIAHRGFFFDLSPWEDEAPVDDPGQPPGADVRMLKEILLESWRGRQGKSLLHVGGFVPWAFKYTNHPGAGGRREGVPTEWRYAEIISCFDAYMDADAIGYAAMANASFFQHLPWKPPAWKSQAPSEADLRSRGLLGTDGKVVPAQYVAFYAGDWDSAAWVYRMMPGIWNDPARGKVPIGWAVNPNLEERFRPGLEWIRRTATANDFFVAGDSGAGYLNPGYLEEPRVHSGLPGGLEAWARHCEMYYRRWGITLTGFIIDGNARGLSPAGYAAYARFSPDGVVPQKCPVAAVESGMPVLRASGDLGGSPAGAARQIAGQVKGGSPGFFMFRSILKSPAWHAEVAEEARKLDPRIRFVDPYTLLALVRVGR